MIVKRLVVVCLCGKAKSAFQLMQQQPKITTTTTPSVAATTAAIAITIVDVD